MREPLVYTQIGSHVQYHHQQEEQIPSHKCHSETVQALNRHFTNGSSLEEVNRAP